MRISINWAHALILFAIFPLVIELTFISLIFEILGKMDSLHRARTKSVEVAAKVCTFMQVLVDSGAVVLAVDINSIKVPQDLYIISLNDAYSTHRLQVDKSLEKLVYFLSADPQYRNFAEALQKKYLEIDYISKEANGLTKAGDTSGATSKRSKATSLEKSLQTMSKELIAKHLANALKRKLEEERLKSAITFLVAASFALNLLGSAFLAFLLNGTIAGNLQTLMRSAESLTAQKPIAERLEGTDEFAELDLAFRRIYKSVSDFKNAEKMIVESAVDLICSLDEEGKFLQVNSACKRLIGYEPDELIGIHLGEIVAKEDSESVKSLILKAVSSAETTTFELKMLLPDGRQIETAWSSVWSDSEQTLFCIAHDLSERKQAERVRQEITAMISHDLRTPLTSIQVAVELFARGTFGPVPAGLSERLVATGAKTMEAMDLVNDLLDIEKFEKSNIELSCQMESVDELLESAWRDIAPLANEKGIKLSLNIEPVEVWVDREQFVRVLRNLLRNSILCSPQGSAVIVGASIEGENIIFKIEDSGPLVPEEESPFIFDRFQNAERVKSPRIAGMGHSLVMCRALVAAHEGELRTGESSNNQFMFLVSLPN